MDKQQVKVRVRDLRVGDTMVPSGEVVRANQYGVRTRVGYREVCLQNGEGDKRWSEWNASTQVWVAR